MKRLLSYSIGMKEEVSERKILVMKDAESKLIAI
jgi:hypothetical protein